ncbi:MAG: hypothetical protein KDJ16_08455 [Hyphomicrobiales bacterium]|nr:hypothetical protein [Hyphomicrobiales bacterium]
MATTKSSGRRTLVLVATTVFSAGLVAPVAAQTFDDTGSSSGILDAATAILGFGSSKKREPIDYSPRSPLVIPPSTELPSPDAGAAGRNDADWPNDPDAAARAKLEAERNKTILEKYPEDRVTARLTPEEIQAGRSPGAIRGSGDAPASTLGNEERANPRLSPTELRSFKKDLDPTPEYGADGLPVRRRLVEPPSEYRVPADTAEYDPNVRDKRPPASVLGSEGRTSPKQVQ